MHSLREDHLPLPTPPPVSSLGLLISTTSYCWDEACRERQAQRGQVEPVYPQLHPGIKLLSAPEPRGVGAWEDLGWERLISLVRRSLGAHVQPQARGKVPPPSQSRMK